MGTYTHAYPSILPRMYNTDVHMENPFTFGALAQDETFVDREPELKALDDRPAQSARTSSCSRRAGTGSPRSPCARCARRAPRTCWSATAICCARPPRSGSPPRSRAPSPTTCLAGRRGARAGGRGRPRSARAAVARGRPGRGGDPLRVRGDPEPTDIDDTLERLLELPGRIAPTAAQARALVLDEFQEIAAHRPGAPER